MKLISKVLLLTIFLHLICIFKDDNVFIKKVVVYNTNKLTVAIDAGFEDENFYNCILKTLGKEEGTILSDEELSAIDTLICKNKNITSINGIEKLTNLTSLNLMENYLSDLDFSNNYNLMYVELSGNPNITTIDLSKNINLKEIYFRNDSLKSIDLSQNVNLENLDLGYNELSTIDLSNNINLKYLYLGYNNLTTIDLSKNVNLIEATLSSNKISSLNVKQNTLLKKLVISGNQLSNVDLSNNIYIEELYASSNNLTGLDISKLSNLKHLNAVFNKFDNLSIPLPSNIVDLVVEGDWIDNYNFSNFTNLKSLRVVDYYVVPIYGTNFELSNLIKYKSSNVDYSDYVLYTDFDKFGKNYIFNDKIINSNSGNTLKYRICSTNISDYHNYCGIEEEFKNLDNVNLDDNILINGIGDYSNIIYYEGYREFKFITLISDKYVIDETKSIIDVGGDTNEEIINNLKIIGDNCIIDIDENNLELRYNNDIIRSFTLQRVKEIPTGSLELFTILGIIFISIICLSMFIKKVRN